jgi:hypothetical protein
LREGHGKKLIPTGEALQGMVAAITSDALLKFFVGQMLHELREDGLAKVHASLSCLSKKIPKRSFFIQSNSNRSRLQSLQALQEQSITAEDGFFPGQS